MRSSAITLILAWSLGGCAAVSVGTGGAPVFNEAEIRAAERALVRALEATDPTEWVYSYTEDAVFVFPGAPSVQGRAQLLEMAKSMKPMSSVSMQPLRTEGSGTTATVYATGSWTNGRPPQATSVSSYRVFIVWRKEADGQWRFALEMLNAGPAAGKP